MLYLLRHEETSLNVENRFRGTANPPLSADGKRAAERLSHSLHFEPDRIVCDSMARTCQTAKIVASGQHIETDEGLRPWDIGDISGTEKTEAAMRNFQASYVDHPGRRPPNGESLNEFLRRWKSVYQGYLDAARSLDILLVVHGSNIGAVLSGFKPVNLQGSITQKPGTLIEVGEDGMPAVSKAQRALMAIAEHNPSAVSKKNRGVLKMSKGQLHDFAATKGLKKQHVMKLSKLARA